MHKNGKKEYASVAAIGPSGVVAGFRALGADVFEATEDADAVFDRVVAEKKYAVIVVAAEAAPFIAREKLESASFPPAVVVLPPRDGADAAAEEMAVLAERALGTRAVVS